MSRQFISFVLAGGIAAAANWGSRLVFSLALSLEAAVVAAYLVGMATAYTLNRLVVFDTSGRTVADEAWRFTLVNIVALVQVWIVTVGLSRWLFPAVDFTLHPEAVAHAIGVASPILSSYIGHRHFTFARRSDAGPARSEGAPRE